MEINKSHKKGMEQHYDKKHNRAMYNLLQEICIWQQ